MERNQERSARKFQKKFRRKTNHLWLVISLMAGINLVHILFLVEYVGLTPGYEREIFQRVQLGMTLTAAGKFCLVF